MSSYTGLPLEIILEYLHKRDMVIDWINFYEEAKSSGWKEKTILNKIETAISDVFGKNYKNQVISRLYSYIN